jgi:hypothetical protein
MSTKKPAKKIFTAVKEDFIDAETVTASEPCCDGAEAESKWEPVPAPQVKTMPVEQIEHRTYTYSEGDKVRVEGVVRATAIEAGGQILNCSNGDKHFISPGWLSIRIETVVLAHPRFAS